ncbi:MAG: hypothetical protein R3B46_05650 [Phycisphaerales bacterium]
MNPPSTSMRPDEVLCLQRRKAADLDAAELGDIDGASGVDLEFGVEWLAALEEVEDRDAKDIARGDAVIE